MEATRTRLASLLALSLACGCSSTLRIYSTPHRVRVSLGGELVAERTPAEIELRRPAFAGERRLRLEAPGHTPLDVPVRFRRDRNCVAACLAVAVVGSPVIVPTVVGLAYLPWCSLPETPTLELELDEEPVLGVPPR